MEKRARIHDTRARKLVSRSRRCTYYTCIRIFLIRTYWYTTSIFNHRFTRVFSFFFSLFFFFFQDSSVFGHSWAQVPKNFTNKFRYYKVVYDNTHLREVSRLSRSSSGEIFYIRIEVFSQSLHTTYRYTITKHRTWRCLRPMICGSKSKRNAHLGRHDSKMMIFS